MARKEAGMMRLRIALAVAFVIPVTPEVLANGQKEAAEIIEKVGNTYRNAQSYHFEAVYIIETKSEGMQIKKETLVVIAAVRPDKMRMEIKGSMMDLDTLMISNGSTTWEYLPRLKQYTRSKGTPTTVTTKGIDSRDLATDKITYYRTWAVALGILLPDYENITETVNKPRLLREEAIEVDGMTVDCYVIEADSAFPQFVTSPKTFWIDKARYLVVRETYSTNMRGSTSSEIKQTTVFKVASVNEPVPDTMFVFSPPVDAKQVDDFTHKGNPSQGRKKPMN